MLERRAELHHLIVMSLVTDLLMACEVVNDFVHLVGHIFYFAIIS